jgi:hypothetical protein
MKKNNPTKKIVKDKVVKKEVGGKLIGSKGNSINQTTIKLMRETKSRLNKLKEFERESYDQIIRKMLYVLNVTRTNPEKAKRILQEINVRISRTKEFDEEKE